MMIPAARRLYDDLAQGWNTWDVRSLTSYVLLPQRLSVAISFFVPGKAKTVARVLWDDVARFGEHSIDGSYSALRVRVHDVACDIHAAASGDQLLIAVTPERPAPDLFVAVEVVTVWGGHATITGDSAAITATVGADHFVIDLVEPPATPAWNPCRAANLVTPATGPVHIRVNATLSAAAIDQTLTSARATMGTGESAPAAAMRDVLGWNTIFEPHHDRVITPVSRNWCQGGWGFGDYVLAPWDNAFAALMLARFDTRLAYVNILAMLEEATRDGMVPNYGSGVGASADRSEPQVIAWCAWQLYQQHGDRWFIEAAYSALLAWNRWRFATRDPNGDGLIELGTVQALGQWNDKAAGTKQGAMYESGMDNSPMWDAIAFNEMQGCMEVADVGTNALLALDCECLAQMAALLGHPDEEAELHARHDDLAERINTLLWDDEQGTYANRDWSGRFHTRHAPTMFLPLLAGIAAPERAQTMIERYLLDPAVFWDDLPSISRSDPAFAEQTYWRGRIWPPLNFLVGAALRRAGYDALADQLAQRGLDLFMTAWRDKGWVGENYNAITGTTGDQERASSDPFYHWGALLVYSALLAEERGDKA